MDIEEREQGPKGHPQVGRISKHFVHKSSSLFVQVRIPKGSISHIKIVGHISHCCLINCSSL